MKEGKIINIETANIVNVLVVDDSKENVLSIKAILQEIDNINILEAFSGEDALRTILTENIDILLTDVRMPNMTGFEVAELLKGTKSTRDIPIIFISGEIMDQNHVFKGYKIGGVDYILKPFEPMVLRSKVEVFVNLKRQNKKINQLMEIQNKINTEISEKNKILKKEINKRDLFYSIVAHDIRSPLSGIIGLIGNLIEEEERDINAIYSGLKMIKNSAMNLEDMLENLLMWSKSQSSYLKPSKEKIIVNEIIFNICTELKVVLKKKNIKINIKYEKNYIVQFDKNMFVVVIRNLVYNAIKFSIYNSEINIVISEEKKNIKIAVEDFGIGMTEEEIKKVFNIEKRFKKQGTAGEKGSGLGLLVCKEFIEKNNGKILVKGKKQKGTIFEILLPKL